MDISGLLASYSSRIHKPHDPVRNIVSKNNVNGTSEEFYLGVTSDLYTRHFCACVGWKILVSESWNTEHF